MKKLLGIFGMLLLFAQSASAQITIPNAFVTRQVISSSKVNANFNQLGTYALNRTAPVLQATLAVDTDAAYDLGAVATRFRNAYLSGTVTAGTFSGSGASLTALPAAQLTGSHTLPDGVLSTNVPLLNAANTFTLANTFTTGFIAPALTGGVSGLSGKHSEFTLSGSVVNETVYDRTGLTYVGKQMDALSFEWRVGSTSPTSAMTLSSVGGLALTATANASYVFGAASMAEGQFNILGNGSASNVFAVKAGTAGQRLLLAEDSSGNVQFQVWNDGAVTFGNNTTHPAAGTLNVFGGGQHVISAGPTGVNSLRVENTAAGTGNYSEVQTRNNLTNQMSLRIFSSTYTDSGAFLHDTGVLYSDTGGGINIASGSGSGVIRFYTNGSTLRFGINAAGDFTVGTSNNIFVSTGIPTYSTGGGSIAAGGKDYGFKILHGSGSTSDVVTFGHTWTNAPFCTISQDTASSSGPTVVATTTTLTINYLGPYGTGAGVAVHCFSD